jgi:hypothetical protein
MKELLIKFIISITNFQFSGDYGNAIDNDGICIFNVYLKSY